MSNHLKIEEAICSHPVAKYPYFHVKIKIRNESNSDFYIDKLKINGRGTRDFLIFTNQNFIYEPRIGSNAVSWVIARGDWENNDQFKVEMELISEDKKVEAVSYEGRTPGDGGYWNKNWKYYLSVILTERDGIERTDEPVNISATVYADRIKDPAKEVRVVKVDTATGKQLEIPCQVHSVSKPYKEASDDTIQHSQTFDVGFYAQVGANEGGVYLVFYGNDRAEVPQYESEMNVKGTGIGIDLENPYYSMKMHPKSGSLHEVDIKMGKNKRLEHKIETNGAIHWNPGIYSPPRAWTHVSDWESPAKYFQIDGPIFTIAQRYDKLPLYPEAMISQTYVFYSRCPYVRVNSVLDITKDVYVQALRNGEIVFNHELAKEFALRDKFGEVKSLTITDLPRFEEIGLRYAADTPWVAFFNSEYGLGFAEITLNLANMRREGGLVRLEHYEQYLNWGPWVYSTRDLIFPFGSQNPQKMTLLPGSSTYFEDMVFLPFIFKDCGQGSKFDMVEKVYKTLSNPLNVQVEYDTDHRVPAQFVLGERLEGEVEETEDKPWPINLSREFTRFRQSPTFLSELYLKKKNGDYYYK
ncbi:MAG: hypothetical protein ACQEP5_03245 [Actinomycetota bacterium]